MKQILIAIFAIILLTACHSATTCKKQCSIAGCADSCKTHTHTADSTSKKESPTMKTDSIKKDSIKK